MRVVDILRRRPDAETEELVRLIVSAPGEPATYEVLLPELREGLEQMIAEGLPGDRGGWFHLADGDAFLDATLAYYHGSRYWASEIQRHEPAELSKPGDPNRR